MTEFADLRITRAPGLVEAEIDGQMVGLHIANGTCYGFNETAYRVWQLVAAPTTLAVLCETVTGEYDVDPAACAAELCAVLRDMASDGLVTLTPA